MSRLEFGQHGYTAVRLSKMLCSARIEFMDSNKSEIRAPLRQSKRIADVNRILLLLLLLGR